MEGCLRGGKAGRVGGRAGEVGAGGSTGGGGSLCLGVGGRELDIESGRPESILDTLAILDEEDIFRGLFSAVTLFP